MSEKKEDGVVSKILPVMHEVHRLLERMDEIEGTRGETCRA